MLKYFNGWNIPNDGNWCDGYSDEYDFAWVDEFKGHWTIQRLNAFVEGMQMSLPQRNKPPYLKNKNMPVIVTSNYSIENCYRKADFHVVSALKDRFIEIEVPTGNRIDLQFEFDESDEDTCEMLSETEEEEEFIYMTDVQK